MSRPAAAEAAAALQAVMSAHNWRWYVFGAQAVLVHGRPRMTADLDVTAAVPDVDLPAFVAALGRAQFQLRVADWRAFFERTRVLPFVHAPTQLPIDVVIAGPGLEEEFLDRAVSVDLGCGPVPVMSAEDLVITKILAGRPKDIEDARGVLAVNRATLDLSRVHELLGLLEEALDRSDLLAVLTGIAEER